jgi:arylsulfatase A-like enzyme
MYPSQHGAHYNSEAIVRYFYEAQAGKKIDLEKIFWNCNASLSKENYTLAEALSEKGYRTAGVVGGIYCSPGFGLAQGFDYYDFTVFDASSDIKFFLISQVVGLFYPLNDFFTQYGYSGAKRIADHLNKVAFRWLEENCEQPFFLFINYFDPHRPYLPPHPYDEYFGKIDKGIIVNRNPKGDLSYITAEENLSNAVINGDYRLTPQEKELIISRYDGEIRYLDHCLGLLFEKLKALKIYDNTLIIVTSDHGEAFGEHNLMYHGKTLYEELLRVPLIIKYPSTSSLREVVEKRVSLVDLFPTILSFLNYPVPPGISGGNLKDSDHPILAENYLSSWVVDKRSKRFLRNLKVIYQGNMKYIWASNSLHELYDLEKDPREEENLIAKFPHKAEVMQKALTQWLVSLKPPKTEREKVKIGKETVERLRALGYVR